ncbi:Na+/H+ antiporter NhaC family protein [Kangiella sediminilitoris]|uniref:Sodium:proton antiporter n=1 Tax=Kangiella sediminilitoris TaxID=1144748 RepID=A0A1B3B7R3_9GAMM|nr:Na+/H+ antiporter NhaC family protein [Kangiella sediminilitoris]AOE48829.1 sodium:proton antiporter [Kangiella sediminilitoris]
MSWLSILPPVVAIIFAIWKREVTIALLLAIFTASLILMNGNPIYAFTDTVDRIIAVFSSAYNTRILLFSLLIGALIQLIKTSGGVTAFVNWLTHRSLVDNQRKAGMLPTILGSSIFIDTNMSVLTAGLSSQALFDKFKMSRVRLAYIIDSTCAPISVLILLNGWGAAILGHVEKTGIQDPTSVMIGSIGLNFYAIVTLLIVFYTVFSTRVYGPMKSMERDIEPQEIESTLPQATKKRYMLAPLIFMVVSILVFMFITGDGDLRQGSGSESVLWSVILSTILAFLLLRYDGKHSTKSLMAESFKGLGNLLPLVTLVLLAFALSSAMGDLETGPFVAQAVGDFIPLWLIPALIFVLAGFISFTTGTSWGTFGILIPIAVPLALALGISPSLVLGAVLGGAVFGDHASPISDTTVISSLAAGCDLLDHVKTQLPYALTAGGISIVLYIIFGLIQ